MSNLLQEMQEETKNEKLLLKLKKIGPFIVAILIVSLFASVLFTLYDKRQREIAHNEGMSYSKALVFLSVRQLDAAMPILHKLGHEGKSAYSDIAMINHANLSLSQKNDFIAFKDGCNKVLERSSNEAIKNYITFILLLHAIEHKELPFDEAVIKIKDYINDGIFRYSALEALAFLLVSHEKYSDATMIVSQILQNDIAPESIKNRVMLLEKYIKKYNKTA